MNDDESEIIFIRKRHEEGDDDHHGGVWKLAFADFMTAMMAFFLVMWLINSTSKEVKAAIVQYFNPVQLIDSNPARKGLRDPLESGLGRSAQRSATENNPSQSKDKDGPQREAELLYDPIATLDQIAGSYGSENSPAATKSGQKAPAFGDPFDRSARGGYIDEPVEDNRSPDRSAPIEQPDEPATRVAQPAPSTPKSAAQHASPLSTPLDDKPKSEASLAAAMRSTLEKIAKPERGAARSAPQIDVADTSEGLLISLTDDVNFSMFAVGSVEPKPQLVRIIGEIGRMLSKQPGEIELRGHTDGRSYKSATYDNWRLSADRANMAYYMLVRGGLAEKRVIKIAGYADRRLKNPKDPLSAVNRRIEILLRRSER